MQRYRNRVKQRAFEVYKVEGTECPWRVRFLADGEETGGGRFKTADEADEAGVEYIFGGWGDDSSAGA